MQGIANRAPARASSTRYLQVLILGMLALGLPSAALAGTPEVQSVTSTTANGTYGENATIVINVVFSEAVDVTSNGNATPKLALNSNASALATYFSGSGSTTLVFHYTVGANHSTDDLNYSSTSALDTYGGAIAATADATQANLILPALTATNSLGGSKSISIDSSSPYVLSVSSTKANGSYKAGEVIPITVLFNKNVTVTSSGNAQPYITLTGVATNVDYKSGSGTNTLTFEYTVADGDTSSDLDYASTTALNVNGGTIADSLGNNATLTLAAPGNLTSLGANKAIVIDTTAPTVAAAGVSSTKADNTAGTAYGIGTLIPITVTFSEAVFVTSNASITLETGTSDGVANYVSGTGTTVLTFNYTVLAGHEAADMDYASTTALATSGSIKDAAGNDATLTLATPGAAGSLAANKTLHVNTDPVVSQVQPAQGPTAGGNVVQIIGSNFSNVTDVDFGTTDATSYVVISSTLISATVPAGTAGAVAVSVTSSAGTGTKASAYTYVAAPTVTSVDPDKGPVAGGKTVTITGTNFTAATVVKFDGIPVSSFTVTSATTVSAVIPAHAVTTAPVGIAVTTAGGTGTGNSLFSYVGLPTITSLDKNLGPIAGGQSVVITGTNFDTTLADNTVTIGGVAATVTAATATTLTVTTGAHAAGPVDVVVTTAGGTATRTKGYTYAAQPTITAITPDKGDIAGGTSITITGTNLTGVTKVTIGGVDATNFVLASTTKITCTTGAHAAGVVNVDLVAAASDRTALAASTFTYGSKPTVTNATLPDGAMAEAYTTTTLTGTGSPTFTVTGLPQGLKLDADTAEISGTPSKAGSYAVTVTAKNDFGTTTKVLTIKVTNPDGGLNNAPEFSSQPFAFPNPAVTNEKVTLTALATDFDKNNLSYVWTITDSQSVEVAKVAGPSTSYTFTVEDVYTITLVVSDGTTADDITSTFDINVGGLSVNSASLKFNFKTANKDNLKLTGTIGGMKDFVPTDEQVSLTVGSSSYTMTLNSKGKSTGSKTETFAITGKQDKTTSGYTVEKVKFSASLVNKDLFATLNDLGFVNADVLKPGALITVPVFVSVNDKSYVANLKVIYTAKQGSAGTGALKKK